MKNKAIAVAAAALCAAAQMFDSRAGIVSFKDAAKIKSWDAWDDHKAPEPPKERRCVTREKLNALDPGLREIGRLAVRGVKESRASKWSVGCECLDRDYADWNVYKSLIEPLGAKRGRLLSGWAKTEQEKGKYDFTWLDPQVREMAAMGVEPWICLGYGNPVYGNDFRLGMRIKQITENPEAFEAWLKYVTACVERYKDVVDKWEIWNEPFHQGPEYAEMFYRTAKAIRAVHPSATCYCTALSFPLDYKCVLEKLKKENAFDLASLFIYHPYFPNPDVSYPRRAEPLRRLVKSYCGSFDIMNGEAGCPSQLEYAHALPDIEWTEYSQAKWNLRLAVGDAARSIPANVFTMIDLRYTFMLQSFGLVRSNLINEYVYRRPLYFAMQNVYAVFDDDMVPKGHSIEKIGGRDMTCCRFAKKGKGWHFYWYSGEVPNSGFSFTPVELEIPEVLERPVWVEMATGRVFEIPGSSVSVMDGRTVLRNVPMWDSPVGITSRSAVTLSFAVTSPDGRNEITVRESPLRYEVKRDGIVLVGETPMDLVVDGTQLSRGAGVPDVVVRRKAKGPELLETPVYKKSAVDLDRNETFLDFGEWGVAAVARNDGVAWRFELSKSGAVTWESADVTIPKASRCWFNRTKRTALGHEEAPPEFADASALATDGEKAFCLPFVYSVAGRTVAVVESGVEGYPAWYFGDVEPIEDGKRLKSFFAKYPKKTARAAYVDDKRTRALVPSGGRWIDVLETEGFIAPPRRRVMPWRAFALADSPSKLCESDIVFALAEPAAKDADFSWVKPGKVAWDWWNAFDNKGEPQGCTTETYVRFIDFAAENGIEYVILDEGWSAKLDIWKFNPSVDVPFLIDYAGKKGVGIVLWMAWAQVAGDEERVAEHFARLGAKGFKVDFMDRADADISTFLDKFAAACAKNRMLVDYHGIYHPTGLQRKYPNILNYEAVHGLEQMKWAKPDKDMCMNDVACFFARMTAGPMDYTPGAMDNYPTGRYGGDRTNPGSVGTRCHQMALLALYEAPLQMLCDSPTKYARNAECLEFMAKVPVVWSETVGLGGCPESLAAVARKSNDGAWYAAAISNSDERDWILDTSFLGEGAWSAEIFCDADDSALAPTHYFRKEIEVVKGDAIPVHLAPGGGFIVRFEKSDGLK